MMRRFFDVYKELNYREAREQLLHVDQLSLAAVPPADRAQRL